GVFHRHRLSFLLRQACASLSLGRCEQDSLLGIRGCPVTPGTPGWSSCHAVRTGCWRHRTFPDSPCGAAGGPASSVPRSLHSLEETTTIRMEETTRVETRLV